MKHTNHATERIPCTNTDPNGLAAFEALESRLLLNSAPVFAVEPYDLAFGAGMFSSIAFDARDADGDSLTVTAISDNPNITPVIESGNRFAQLNFTEEDGSEIGSILAELYEQRMPLGTERFITLATNEISDQGELNPEGTPYYTDVNVHRIIDDFMFQTGDAENGNGTGGSPLPNFNNEYDASLDFSRRGVMAFANSGANTNDSQIFITDGPVGLSPFEYSIFGQVVRGWDAFDSIITRPVHANPSGEVSAPDEVPLMSSVDILDDRIGFQTAEGYSGAAEVTITVSDGNGGQVSRTVSVIALADRPTTDQDALLTMPPGETRVLSYSDDGGLPFDLTASCNHVDVQVDVDQAAGTVTVTTPADFQGIATLTVVTAETGYDEVDAAQSMFTIVSALPWQTQGVSRMFLSGNSEAGQSVQVGDLLYVLCKRSSGQQWSGIEIYDVSDPASPSLLSTYESYHAQDIVFRGSVAYLADGYGGLVRLDISDLSNIETTAYAQPQNDGQTYGEYADLQAVGDTMLVADKAFGLQLYDIADTQGDSLEQIDWDGVLYDNVTLTTAHQIELLGDRAYITGTVLQNQTFVGALVELDVSDPANPSFVALEALDGVPYGLRIVDNKAYVVDYHANARKAKGEMVIFDVSTSGMIEQLGRVTLDNRPWTLDVSGNLAVVGNAYSVQFVDVADPARPAEMFSLDTSSVLNYPSIEGDTVYVGMESAGVVALDVAEAIDSRLFTGKGVFIDENGTEVIMVLSGDAYARVYQDEQASGAIRKVEVFDSTDRTNLKIKARGDSTIDDVIVHGPMRNLITKGIDLGGDLTVEGELSKLVLGDVDADHEIRIHTDESLAVDARLSLNVILGEATSTLLDTGDVPIRKLKADAWNGGQIDAPSFGMVKVDMLTDVDLLAETDIARLMLGQWTNGSLTADTLGQMNVRGNRRSGSTGDVTGLTMALANAEAGAGAQAAGKVNIAGEVSNSTFHLNGPVGTLMANRAENVDVDQFTELAMLKLNDAANLDLLGENAEVGNVKMKGDWAAGLLDVDSADKVAINGDLDGVTIALRAENDGRRTAAKKIVVNGAVRDSEIRARANVDRVMAGAMENSCLFVGVQMDYAADVQNDTVTDLPLLTSMFESAGTPATLGRVDIRGGRGLEGDLFANSNIAAGRINVMKLRDIQVDATTPFGVAVLENLADLGLKVRQGRSRLVYDGGQLVGAPQQFRVEQARNSDNTPPVAGDDGYAGQEDQALTTGNVLANDSDADGEDLFVSGFTQPGHGVVSHNGDGTFDYEPDADFAGTDTFTYNVSDGEYGSYDTAVVTITVAPINDAPRPQDDAFSTEADTPVTTTNVLANDLEVDGETLSVVEFTQPTNGSVTHDGSGVFTYTPDAGFNGADAFTYTVSDGQPGSAGTATVTVYVAMPNIPPTAVDDAVAVDEDGTVQFDARDNDSDLNGDSLSIDSYTEPANGSVTLLANNEFIYSPDSNFFGTDTFTYVLSDGNGGTDSATVTVTVAPVNDAPDAQDDSFTAYEGEALTTDDVRANDVEPDGDELSVTAWTDPDHGTVTYEGDGVFTYTADANYVGADSFTYTVLDAGGATSSATISLDVQRRSKVTLAEIGSPDFDEQTYSDWAIYRLSCHADPGDNAFTAFEISVSGVHQVWTGQNGQTFDPSHPVFDDDWEDWDTTSLAGQAFLTTTPETNDGTNPSGLDFSPVGYAGIGGFDGQIVVLSGATQSYEFFQFVARKSDSVTITGTAANGTEEVDFSFTV